MVNQGRTFGENVYWTKYVDGAQYHLQEQGNQNSTRMKEKLKINTEIQDYSETNLQLDEKGILHSLYTKVLQQ